MIVSRRSETTVFDAYTTRDLWPKLRIVRLFVGLLFVGRAVGAGEPKDLAKHVEDVNKWHVQHEEALRAWRSWKFGIFICVGPASAGVRAFDAKRPYNPARFDAEKWAALIEESGARYTIFTAQWHDNFCMWDTKTTRLNQPIRDITDTPLRRDMLAEHLAACNKRGIPTMVYFSGGDPKTYRIEELAAQIEELAAYPHAGFWFDNSGLFHLRREELGDLPSKLRATRPDRIMGRKDDFLQTPEGVPGKFLRAPWERCQTYYSNWYLGGEKRASGTVPMAFAVALLARTCGNGGNLALNIPPNGEGEFEPGYEEFLKAMGQWLKANGESIYTTEGGPYYDTGNQGQIPWGASTCRENKVFLHLLPVLAEKDVQGGQWLSMRKSKIGVLGLGWDGQRLELPALPDRKLVKAYVLGRPEQSLPARMDDKSLIVDVPQILRDPLDTIVVLELDKDAVGIKPIRTRVRP